MPEVSIKVDEGSRKGVIAALDGIKNGEPIVLSRAINKVAKPAESLLVKDAAKQTGISQKLIRQKNIRLRRASYRILSASIKVFGRGIPVIKLKARQTRKGVTFKGPNGRELIPGAFIAKMPSGHEGVFKRRAGGTRRELRERQGRRYLTELPIDEQRVPGIPDKVVASGAFAQAEAQAAARLPAEIVTQTNVLLEQQARKNRALVK